MEIIPAIDLKGGRCVRLYQGDYSQETVFSDDPVAMAKHWALLGAGRLHVVDLDGAATGSLCHIDLIREMVKAVSVAVQVGGGIRETAAIEKLLDAGVSRAVLGTAAVEQPDVIGEACQRFGEGVVVGIDARQGMVAVHGWKTDTAVTALELAKRMESIGARRFIYTDILKDGTLSRPNLRTIKELKLHTTVPLIAAGGISRVEDLVALSRVGVEGAIVGRALYTGDLKLEEALAALRVGE